MQFSAAPEFLCSKLGKLGKIANRYVQICILHTPQELFRDKPLQNKLPA
jgi:hypothetical protein